MHMQPDDMLVLETAADVLDRHGHDSNDLRACIDAARQANEDEAVGLSGDDDGIADRAEETPSRELEGAPAEHASRDEPSRAAGSGEPGTPLARRGVKHEQTTGD